MDVQIETVNSDGFSADYFRFGSGIRPFVILPGISVQSVMNSAAAVASEYRVMKDDFTVYLFDRKKELHADCSIAGMANDTAVMMDALGLKDVRLFGASQGGMIAFELAADRPDLVGKLAVASTSINVTGERLSAIERWIGIAEQRDGEALYRAFAEAIYPREIFEKFGGMLAQMGKTVTESEFSRFVTLARAAKGFDIRPRVGEIRCDLFAAGSTDDKVLGGNAINEIIDAVSGRPGFRYHVYDGFGHAAYDTAPDFRDRLYEFFIE